MYCTFGMSRVRERRDGTMSMSLDGVGGAMDSMLTRVAGACARF